MQTVMIYDELDGQGVGFILFDEDMTRFNNTYVNDMNSQLSSELCDIIFDDDGEYKVKVLDKFPTEAVRNGAEVIVAGFIC